MTGSARVVRPRTCSSSWRTRASARSRTIRPPESLAAGCSTPGEAARNRLIPSPPLVRRACSNASDTPSGAQPPKPRKAMKVVIVGNGVAGVTTARLAVERDPSLDVTIYSEAYHYYSRPRLVDRGRPVTPADIQVYPEEWYAERHIRTVLNTRVTHLEPPSTASRSPAGRRCRTTGWCWPPGRAPGCRRSPGRTPRRLHPAHDGRRGGAARCGDARPSRTGAGGGLLGLEVAAALTRARGGGDRRGVFPRLLPRSWIRRAPRCSRSASSATASRSHRRFV